MTKIDISHDPDVQFTDRTVPWMKLGKLTDEPKTAAEAAKLAGIDFSVSARRVAFEAPDGAWTMIDDRRTIVRDTDETPFGVVSAGYPILQYAEAFDFMDSVTDGQDTRYVAAGALRGGRQGFMVVHAPDQFQRPVLGGDDPHEFFIVLRTSHDRTRGCEILVMPLRGRCMNQLTLKSFSRGATNRWVARHTSTMALKLADAQTALTNLGKYTERYVQVVDRLATIKLTEAQSRQVLERVEPKRAKTADKIDSILHLWNEAATVGYPGTGWGLVNAISDYYDWGRSGGSAESRFVAAMEGQTYKAVNNAASILLSRDWD